MTNVFKKIQDCRVELQNMNLKKSGKNKFSNYDYYELGDFLPAINLLMQKHGLSSNICFDEKMAHLIIRNTDKIDEFECFSSPMSTATLKGCHEVQNLGAVQTYLRRYLYMNAFEIVEHDALDPLVGSPDSKTQVVKLISQDQVTRLYAIAKGHNDQAKTVLAKYNYTSAKDIKTTDYDAICKEIEQVKLISQDQVTRLYAIAKGHNDQTKTVLAKYNYASAKDIKTTDYDAICKEIEQVIAGAINNCQ